jgi:predicted alpha/beta hydrolase family esterase
LQIEQAVATNGSPVVLVAHSMGGLMALVGACCLRAGVCASLH